MTVHGKEIEIQEELKEIIRTYNKVTSRHNIMMVCLTAIIALSAIATFRSNYFLNKTGQYAVSAGKWGDGVYVLDTKTTQLWHRSLIENMYLGTTENPRKF